MASLRAAKVATRPAAAPFHDVDFHVTTPGSSAFHAVHGLSTSALHFSSAFHGAPRFFGVPPPAHSLEKIAESDDAPMASR